MKNKCKTCWHATRVKTDEGFFCVPTNRTVCDGKKTKMVGCRYYSKNTIKDYIDKFFPYNIDIQEYYREVADRTTLEFSEKRCYPWFGIKFKKKPKIEDCNYRKEYKIEEQS